MRTRSIARQLFLRHVLVRRGDSARRAGLAPRIRVEQLEDRTTPVINQWIGGDGLWSDDASWSLTHAPTSSEDVEISNGHIVTHNANSDTVNSISISGSSTLILSGGSITDGDLGVAGATSFFKLQGGILAGANLLAGSTITATTSGGTLNSVTLNGILDVTTAYSARVSVTGGLTLANGAILKIGDNVGDYGYVSFNGGNQTLSGSGSVLFGDSVANTLWTGQSSGTNLTIGPNILIHGQNGYIGLNTAYLGGFTDGTFTNQGTISADVSGGAFRLEGTNWTNSGTIQAQNGGTVTLARSWTNSGTFDVAAGSTLNLAGTFATSTLGTINSAGATVNLTGTLTNDAPLTLNDTTGSWRFAGGTIDGGTIATTGSNALIGTTSGGLLANGVTLDGTLDLNTVNGARVTVTGGLILANGTVLKIGDNVGDYGYVSFNGGNQTLGGTGSVLFGNSVANTLWTGAVSGTNLTIGPDILVHGQNGYIGLNTAYLGGFTDGTFTNQGTISADVSGGAFRLEGTNWSNAADSPKGIQVAAGATMTLAGSWSNSGTIAAAAGSTLNLAGTFATSTLGTINGAGATVNLTGTLTNDAPLTLNDTTGSWRFAGGTIDGGTIATTGSNALIGTTSGGLLANGVTLDGTLDLNTVNGARVTVTGGLILANGTVLKIGDNVGDYGYVSFNGGNQTLGGTGSVLFGNSVANTLWTGAVSGTNLTIGPDILVHGQNGYIGLNTAYLGGFTDGTFTNQGTISADVSGGAFRLEGTNWSNAADSPKGIQVAAGATMTLAGSWSNSGTIAAAAGSTLNLAGTFNVAGVGAISSAGATVNFTGILTNTGTTVTLDGPWRLAGGTIDGGTIATTGGGVLIATTSGGLLANGVTLDGNLDLTTAYSARVTVTGGLTLANGTVLKIGDNVGDYGYVSFNGGNQTLGGTGSVLFGNSPANTLWTGQSSGTNLTIGPNIFVHGQSGYIGLNTTYLGGYTDGTFTNQGTISADVSGGTFQLDGLNWTNAGTVQAQNGGTIVSAGTNANYSGGTLTGGTWKVFDNSALRLIGGSITNNAADIVLDGVNSNLFSDMGSTNALAGFAANAAGGSFTILNGRDFTTAGTLSNAGDETIGAGSTLSLAAGENLTQTGGVTTVNGALATTSLVDIQGGLLQGSGTIAGNVTNAGQMNPGPTTSVLTIDGDYTQTSAGELDLEIGGIAAGTQFDQLNVAGTVSLDGALNVSLINGFIPGVGNPFLILDKTSPGAVGGTFAGHADLTTVFVGGVPRFQISYAGAGNDVVLTAINIAPTLDSIPDPAPILENAGLQTINLTGITAGGGETQFLTVTAHSSNLAVVPDPDVNYTSPNAIGSISYTPAADTSGVAFITVTVTDDAGTANGGVDTFSRTFRVEVGFVNHVPSFTKGSDEIVLEDGGSQTVNAWATNIDPGGAEDAGQALTFLISTNNDALFSVLPAIDPVTGDLTYTPAANANGSATITVRLMDDGGTANDGVDTSDPQTFGIAVTAVNDAPSFTKGSDQTIQEDAGSQIVAGWATAISAGPANESGQALTFQVTTDNDGLFAVLPSVDSSGQLTYTPADNANGSAIVTVTLNDDGGTSNGGVNAFTQTFAINVLSVNDQPVLDVTGTPLLPFIPVLGKSLPTGGLISDLTKFVADADAGAIKGTAIIGADITHGQWWYNLTGADADWTVLPTVAADNALLLGDDGNTRVRFVPKKGFAGFASLTFKAWDQTDLPKIEGDFDNTTNASNTAFSADSDRAWIAVGKTKPTVDPDGQTVLKTVLPVYKENAKIKPLAPVLAKDIVGIAGLEKGIPKVGLGVAITAADEADGHWEFFDKTTKTWTGVNPVSELAPLFLKPTDKLRFVPADANADGPAPLTFHPWDGTTTGASTGTAVLDLVPILDLSVPAVLNPIDATHPPTPALFGDLMSASRVVGSNVGVAVIATKGAGIWDYSSDGVNWVPVDKVSTGKALFLNLTDWIRFTPTSNTVPQTASLSFKAWDMTRVAAYTRGPASGTSVSKETEILTVAVANHKPTLSIPGVTLPAIPVSQSNGKGAGMVIKTALHLVTAQTDDPLDGAKPLKGIAITAVTGNGTWQYSLGGNVWRDVGGVSTDRQYCCRTRRRSASCRRAM